MKRILLKSIIFYMVLAQALANVAYARHVCVMDDAGSSSHSVTADKAMPDHPAEQASHEHADDDCVCAGGHQHCSASLSITIDADITVESSPTRDTVALRDSHPFPAHLTDLIRPPSSLSC